MVLLSLTATLQCIYPCIYAVFCLANVPGHRNEGQKQEPDYPAQSLAEIMFLQLRKFALIQPRQVMETRLSRPPSLLALSVSQLLSCFYPSCLLTAPPAPRRHRVSASCALAPQPLLSKNGTSLDPGLSLPKHFPDIYLHSVV